MFCLKETILFQKIIFYDYYLIIIEMLAAAFSDIMDVFASLVTDLLTEVRFSQTFGFKLSYLIKISL